MKTSKITILDREWPDQGNSNEWFPFLLCPSLLKHYFDGMVLGEPRRLVTQNNFPPPQWWFFLTEPGIFVLYQKLPKFKKIQATGCRHPCCFHRSERVYLCRWEIWPLFCIGYMFCIWPLFCENSRSYQLAFLVCLWPRKGSKFQLQVKVFSVVL